MTGSSFTFNSAQIKCTSYKTGEHSRLLLEVRASSQFTLSTVTLQSSAVLERLFLMRARIRKKGSCHFNKPFATWVSGEWTYFSFTYIVASKVYIYSGLQGFTYILGLLVPKSNIFSENPKCITHGWQQICITVFKFLSINTFLQENCKNSLAIQSILVTRWLWTMQAGIRSLKHGIIEELV